MRRSSSRLLYVDNSVSRRSPAAPLIAFNFSQGAHFRQTTLSPLAHPCYHGLDVRVTWWRPMHAPPRKRLSVPNSHSHAFFSGHASVLSRLPHVLGFFLFFNNWFRTQPAPELPGLGSPHMVPVVGREEANYAEERYTDRSKCNGEWPKRCWFGGHVCHAEYRSDESQRL